MMETMCWWISRNKSSQTEEVPMLSSDNNLCSNSKPSSSLLHRRRESTNTQPTYVSWSLSDNSLDSRDENCPVTGSYSDIHADYSLSSSSHVLGSGRYGTVRRCTHRASGNHRAVKSVLKANVEHNLDYLKREVRMLSAMDHPNVIKMIACYEDYHSVHIVSEMYRGGELFDRVADAAHRKRIQRDVDGSACGNGGLSQDEARGIMRQLLEAVSYLHAREVLHRDIKLENILFESSSSIDDGNNRNENMSLKIRLVDFGFSRHLPRGESLSTKVGTLEYMSPELIRGHRYEYAVDVWSAGVIAYILLCGHSPFYGSDDDRVAKDIVDGRYTFAYGWDGVSDSALDFIRCLLEVDPKKRWTAEEALMHPWLK